LEQCELRLAKRRYLTDIIDSVRKRYPLENFVARHLTKRSKLPRRMDFKWRDRSNKLRTDCVHMYLHEELCECDLVATIKSAQFQNALYIMSRKEGNRVRTNEEMIEEMMAKLSVVYYFQNNELRMRERTETESLICHWQVKYSVAQNQTPIPKMLNRSILPREAHLHPVPAEIYEYYRDWDLYYFNKVYHLDKGRDFFEEYVWKSTPDQEGLPWDILRLDVLTLQQQMLVQMSWYNRTFTGDENGRYVSASQLNIFKKTPVLMAKNDHPTRDLSSEATLMMNSCLQDALKDMYDYMDMAKHEKRYWWDWDPSAPYRIIPRGSTASGLRHCPPNKQVTRDGVTHKYSGVGKKIEQFPYAARTISEECQRVYTEEKDEIEHPDFHSYMCGKDEKFSTYAPFGKQKKEEQDDSNNKLRFFFLLSYVVTGFAALVGKIRQIVERGIMIKIGLVWWFGGAYNFAKQFLYEDPDMIWEDGDFRGLDRTLNRALLVMYLAGHKRYVRFKAGEAGRKSERLFNAILKFLGIRMPVKFVNLYSDIWVIMYGQMPSGAFETSHGDSWCVGLLFFLYVQSVLKKKPFLRKLYMECRAKGRVVFVVYGDDHVLGIDKRLHPYINERGYAKFVNYYFSMQIRNIRTLKNFLSTEKRDGEITGDGVVFLQKYFVKNKYGIGAPVLPFRPLSKTVIKSGYGSKGEKITLFDYMIASLGMVYDSGGTNDLAYIFCKDMFDRLKPLVEDYDTRLEEYKHSSADTNISRILRKCAISVEELQKGFPTQDHLLSMHIEDEYKNGSHAWTKVYDENNILYGNPYDESKYD
jgi:hypothetical protein